MNKSIQIKLRKKFFTDDERIIIKENDLSISLFKYESSIEAIKLSNNLGHIIVLPYRGQQVWDAIFSDRYLKMKTNFAEPQDVDSFTETYGMFLMHCGILRMGCPGTEDNHPLHGEIPYAKFSEAKLIIGNDGKGNFIGITSCFEYKKAFGNFYIFQPVIKLYQNSAVIDVSIQVDNLSNYPMELMYMAHINFLPVSNGVIIQTAKWNRSCMKIRENFPVGIESDKEYLRLVNRLKDEPELTQEIKLEDVYDPEIVYYFDHILADAQGYAHFMQKHPDGSSDYVRFKVNDLNHGTRWLVKNKDMQALGIILPSTCDADGYIAEKKKGNVRIIEAKGRFKTSILTGYLDREQTTKIEKVIESIVKQ